MEIEQRQETTGATDNNIGDKETENTGTTTGMKSKAAQHTNDSIGTQYCRTGNSCPFKKKGSFEIQS